MKNRNSWISTDSVDIPRELKLLIWAAFSVHFPIIIHKFEYSGIVVPPDIVGSIKYLVLRILVDIELNVWDLLRKAVMARRW